MTPAGDGDLDAGLGAGLEAVVRGRGSCRRRWRSTLEAVREPVARRLMPTFFSKMRRRPCSVSHGSTWLMALGQRPDEAGQAAGGDDRARRPSSSCDALAHAVDQRRVAVDRARLDRLDGAAADHVAGLDQLDPAQRGGPAEQRVEADVDAGEDGAAEVLALGRDRLEGGGGAEVDDDRRAAEEVEGGHGVGDAVGADLLRVVVEDRQPGLHARARRRAPAKPK